MYKVIPREEFEDELDQIEKYISEWRKSLIFADFLVGAEQ